MSRTINLYYLFRALSSAFFFKVFLVFFYLDQNLNFAEIGILQSIFAVTVILFEIPTGFWADRFGRKNTMGHGALIMAIASLSFYFFSGFMWFAILEFLLALGLTFTSGADSAFLYELIKKSGKEKLYAKLEGKAGFAKHTGIALSSLTGGFIASYNLRLLFPATAFMLFFAYLITLKIPSSSSSSGRRKSHSVALHIQNGLSLIKKQKSLWWTIFYSSVLFFLIRSSDTLLQPVMKANGFDYKIIGFFASVGSIIAAISSRFTFFMMKKWTESVLIWGFLLMLTLSYILFAKSSGILLIPLVLLNLGVQGIYSPFTKTLLNRSISYSPMRATLLSLESSVKRFVVALLMPLMGVFIDNFGLKYGLFFSSAIGFLSLLILFLSFTDKLKKSLKIDENFESDKILSDNLNAYVEKS